MLRRLLQTPRAQKGQAEVRVPQRLVRGRRHQAGEPRLGLRELPSFQLEQPLVAQGDELLYREFLLPTPDHQHEGRSLQKPAQRSRRTELHACDAPTTWSKRRAYPCSAIRRPISA